MGARLPWGQPEADIGRRTHGTMSGYAAGCRCDACRTAALASSRRSSMAILRALREDPSDPRHGTWAGYNKGCRCEACREAGAAYRAARR